jgi:hypothetical protein
MHKPTNGADAMATIRFDDLRDFHVHEAQRLTNELHDRQRDSDAQREANRPRRRGGIIALVVVLTILILGAYR